MGLSEMRGMTVADVYVDERVNPPKIVKMTPEERRQTFHMLYIPRLELE